MASIIEVFLCYAQEDEFALKELITHLAVLKRQGFFDIWHDLDISAGDEWQRQIDKHLNTAQIILLLVSQYFMNSDYCYSVAMKQAVERHERGEARVIPIILRPVYWQGTPFARLQVIPRDAKPVTTWQNREKALLDIADRIRIAIEETSAKASLNLEAISGASKGVLVEGHNIANQGHLVLLKQEVSAWNTWRREHPDVQPNLIKADLSGADLSGADLWGTDLSEANLRGADLSTANLSGADLTGATLVSTNFTNAILIDCRIYGIDARNIQLEGANQNNLVITPPDQPMITVDDLKFAQFINLLLNNVSIRDVVDTIATKSVLILGHFTPERRGVINALRDALRAQNYLPILFDFNEPSSRNLTETVRILAHLSRFIIADLTDPSSIPHELQVIIPTLAVPVQPLLEMSKRDYSMFADFKRYHWVLPIYHYTDVDSLLHSLKEKIIEPAEQKAQEITKR